jgi:hypothetical protein
MIRLYGKNRKRVAQGRRCYWTDIEQWRKKRRHLTGHPPLVVNVTSNSKLEDFRNLSPMRMGPVNCYRENGKMIQAASVEVAWQYSKIYSHIISPTGKLLDVREQFLISDAKGQPVPTKEWFAWRDAAFTNPLFNHAAPEFAENKKKIRRPFPKGSLIAYWYWNGKLLNAVEARHQIYARLYYRFLRRAPGFKLLKDIALGRDVNIFDLDGYDWKELRMKPAECLKDLGHSFGHGLIISFLLDGIDPVELIPKPPTKSKDINEKIPPEASE